MNVRAIRSLQCADHAENIPPRVLSIEWMLGKRCNFDCSYCSPHVHDAVSPFIDTERYLEFAAKVNRWALDQSKKIKWSFTGGEPFLDPGFIKILELIAQSSDCTEQTNVVTNGSLPLDFYSDKARLLTGITFSIHLERTPREVRALLTKIIELHKQNITFVSVNLMALQGRLAQLIDIRAALEQAGVPCSTRRIAPMAITTEQLPFAVTGPGRKSIELFDTDSQSTVKNQWRIFNDRAYKSSLQQYYTPEEDAYLEHTSTKPLWQNIGVWFKDRYEEMNSNYLISNKVNSFFNWTCFAGVDQIYIDFDGRIYRALCLNGGAIGHVNDSIGFIDQPTVCQRQWCNCNSDVAVRKANQENLYLISGQT